MGWRGSGNTCWTVASRPARSSVVDTIKLLSSLIQVSSHSNYPFMSRRSRCEWPAHFTWEYHLHVTDITVHLDHATALCWRLYRQCKLLLEQFCYPSTHPSTTKHCLSVIILYNSLKLLWNSIWCYDSYVGKSLQEKWEGGSCGNSKVSVISRY